MTLASDQDLRDARISLHVGITHLQDLIDDLGEVPIEAVDIQDELAALYNTKAALQAKLSKLVEAQS